MTLGGAERLAVQIANARAAAGDAAHLYVLTESGPTSEHIAPGVRVRYFGYARDSIGNPLGFVLSVVRGYRMLARQAKRDRIEVFQSHLPGANFWGLALAWRGGYPVIPTVHSNQEFNYGAADTPLRAKLRRRAYREMLRRCPTVVAVSDGVRDSLIADIGADPREAERVTVVPNGVEIPEAQPPGTLAQVRARYGILPKDAFVLAAGRLTELKNFPALLEAVAALRRRGTLCRVMIAGDGPQRAYLERRILELEIDDLAVLPGTINDLDLLMQAADVFVLPSLWEGLPLVLLEAMACGRACVGTRIKGIAEVVEDGVCGTLVEPGDVGGLTTAIAGLLADPARREAYGTAAREVVRRHYDFARVTRELGALYARLAGRSL
jgi:glycosyltransferase involved in cell wall biosynthesis